MGKEHPREFHTEKKLKCAEIHKLFTSDYAIIVLSATTSTTKKNLCKEYTKKRRKNKNKLHDFVSMTFELFASSGSTPRLPNGQETFIPRATDIIINPNDTYRNVLYIISRLLSTLLTLIECLFS